jgi:hypothetical protein
MPIPLLEAGVGAAWPPGEWRSVELPRMVRADKQPARDMKGADVA